MASGQPAALALVAALLLAGCAARPEPALRVVAPADGQRAVSLLAVTTRAVSDNPGLLFGGERASAVHYAALNIAIPPERQVGEIAWASQPPADPRQHFAATRVERLDRRGFIAALGRGAAERGARQALVFVHGYNTRFDEAAFRFAQIVHDAPGAGGVTPVLFSWPSWGSLGAYPYDRESAAISRDALAALIEELAADRRFSSVAILAHSMGAMVTMEALRTVALRRGALPAKLTDLMLAAPDIDLELAAQQAAAMGPRKPRITLFLSRDDQALNISRIVWGSRDRLGAIDPRVEPHRSGLARAGVEVIDLSDESTTDSLRHGKFAESPRAVQAIGAHLAAGNRLTGRSDGSEGERGVADVARGAVGLVGAIVTAPITILSGETDRGPPR
jgi:esterase/lipase superfamily enzyme